MSVGTSNLSSNLVNGQALTAATVDDVCTLLSRSDDEVLYDLVPLDPPVSASATNVNVGYVPLRTLAAVTPTGAARSVNLNPARYFRSSTSNTTPRRLLSAVLDASFTLALGSVTGGYCRSDLLCARIAYRNALDPAQGTQVTYEWANGVEVLIGNTPANPAAPAHTSTSWVVPLAYVKNTAGSNVVTADVTLVAALANAYGSRVGANGGVATLGTTGKVVQASEKGVISVGVTIPSLSGTSPTGSTATITGSTYLVTSTAQVGDVVTVHVNVNVSGGSATTNASLQARLLDGNGQIGGAISAYAAPVTGTNTTTVLTVAGGVTLAGNVQVYLEWGAFYYGGSPTALNTPSARYITQIFRP